MVAYLVDHQHQTSLILEICTLCNNFRSPNKLNATKKPMLGNNGMANNVVLPAGFAVRRNNNMSPNNKVSNLVNFGNGFHNYQTNPVREPLLNSKGIKGLAFDKS